MNRLSFLIALSLILSLTSCKISIKNDETESEPKESLSSIENVVDESAEYNSGNHLSFKGIPINGNLRLFCDRLKSKGFKLIGKYDETPMFSGHFTDTEVTVGVIATNGGEDVYSIVVLLPSSEEWNQLVKSYDYYKDLYTSKYGNPKESTEINPAIDNDNLVLMSELSSGTVKYISQWEAKGGSIELSIEKSGEFYGGHVVIRYRDNLNLETKRKNDLDEI